MSLDAGFFRSQRKALDGLIARFFHQTTHRYRWRSQAHPLHTASPHIDSERESIEAGLGSNKSEDCNQQRSWNGFQQQPPGSFWFTRREFPEQQPGQKQGKNLKCNKNGIRDIECFWSPGKGASGNTYL